MFGRKITIKRGGRDDAEKPFWISFADLMTALMVLFLVASIAAITKAQTAENQAQLAETQAREDKLLTVG